MAPRPNRTLLGTNERELIDAVRVSMGEVVEVVVAGGRGGADGLDVTDVGEVRDLGSAKGIIVESSVVGAGRGGGDRIGLE